MGKLGNVGAIAQETGPHAARSFRDLDGRLGVIEGVFARVVRNGAIVALHSDLLNLDFASSGHTGFASSAQLLSHTSNTSNPHSTTLEQAITAGGTASTEPKFNGGIDLGTSGRFDSNVVDGADVKQFYFKPTQSLSTASARRFEVDDEAGNPGLIQWKSGTWEFGGDFGGAVDAVVTVADAITQSSGIQFAPSNTTSAGITMVGQANTIVGGTFRTGPSQTPGTGLANVVGGIFQNQQIAGMTANVANWWSAWMRPTPDTNPGSNSGRTYAQIGGWKVFSAVTGKNFGAVTDLYGGYISDMSSNAAATGFTLANQYALYLEEQTRASTVKNGIFLASATAGYKALVLGSQSNWLAWESSTTFSLNATTVLCKADFDLSAKNLVTDTTTGTKIGTATSQKVAAFNATPIVQPTTAVAAATFVANTSGIVDDSATFDGYTLGQVVKALRNLGWLA